MLLRLVLCNDEKQREVVRKGSETLRSGVLVFTRYDSVLRTRI